MSQTKKLSGNIKKFIVQAVLGCYLNVLPEYKNETGETIEKICNNALKIYLNLCYHDYHKKSDKYVMDIFNEIFSCNIIKGSICLVCWCDKFGETLFLASRIPDNMVNKLGNSSRDNIIGTLEPMLNKGFDIYIKKIIIDMEKCESSCKDDYDGTDVFEIVKTSKHKPKSSKPKSNADENNYLKIISDKNTIIGSSNDPDTESDSD